jgi:hypothetical protein
MTPPMAYAARYLSLPVPVVVDDKVTRWDLVRLDRYLLITGLDKDGGMVWDKNHPNNKAALNAMLGQLRAHFAKKGATLTVHVTERDGARAHSEFDAWFPLWYFARKAFFGKGSPEAASITLQLAARFNLLEGLGLQGYCDKYLGLDCNGFVGNYLVHGRRGGDWELAEPPNAKDNYLANTQIDYIIKQNATAVTKIEDLKPSSSYLLGLVGPSGRVIPQIEGGMFGHILVTHPGLGWNAAYPDDKKVGKAWTLYGVESTGGGVGLVSAKCQFVSVTHDGIFTVKRHSHPLAPPSRFRVFRLN